MLSENEIIRLLSEKKLRVTTQRIAIYKALDLLGHACAEDILEEVRIELPDISIATIYNVLDSFASKEVISRIYTGNSKMYFDVTPSNHPHTYCENSHRIMDYHDDELNELIANHFKNREIEGFHLNQVRVQLVGNYMQPE